MKKLWRFLREYKQFSWVVVAALAAVPLSLSGKQLLAHWILGLAAGVSVVPLVWQMVQDVRIGTYGIDVLAAAAIITALLMGEFWTAMVIVLMLTGGESLEDYAESRAKKELDALLTRAPQKAHVLRGRKTVDVPVLEVQVGDKLLIKGGELVPVDAVILEGSADVDESSLTGESLPAPKQPGDSLLSGTVNQNGMLTVRAVHTAADSQYEQIIKMVRSAEASRAPFVRLADRYAVPFTFLSFTIALAAWLVSHQSIRFLEVLVVATPCPLILAAPIAIISGMSLSAKHGIIVKTGAALEQLAAARTFAFDKTGTLTESVLSVDSIKTFNDFSTKEILSAAATLEQGSTHTIAEAIAAEAEAQHLRLGKPRHIQVIAGNGLAARVGGKDVLVGRLSLLEQHDVELPQVFRAKSLRQTTALVAINGRLAGVIMLTNKLRPESTATLAALKAAGIKNFLMVTGDNAAAAKAIGQQLGITNIKAETLPGGKLHAIEAVTERPVAFVGDGVNDAPVLTAAEVGIALGARGATAASESADVVIMLDDLGRVARAVEIAKRTLHIAKQSVLVGIALSVVLMVIFSTGHFKPLYGAVIQEVVDIVVIFNALRAHGGSAKLRQH